MYVEIKPPYDRMSWEGPKITTTWPVNGWLQLSNFASNAFYFLHKDNSQHSAVLTNTQ